MKALFIQIQQKESGVKVTSWLQEFSYQESCRHVYLQKGVYKNGHKSTIPAFAKASGRTKKDIPNILRTNTYFWHPSNMASGRRAEEAKREDEMRSFMIDNSEEATFKLNLIFSADLKVDEKILIDYRGAYLHTENGDYHLPETITKKAIEDARMRIAETKKTLETV